MKKKRKRKKVAASFCPFHGKDQVLKLFFVVTETIPHLKLQFCACGRKRTNSQVQKKFSNGQPFVMTIVKYI